LGDGDMTAMWLALFPGRLKSIEPRLSRFDSHRNSVSRPPQIQDFQRFHDDGRVCPIVGRNIAETAIIL